MPCPYFYPVSLAEQARQPARAPLGQLYEGRCEANPQATTREICNFGYAREICAAFPHDAVADAVRFSRVGAITLYILEQDHLPIRHGDASSTEGALRRQAEVFDLWMAK